MCLSNCASPPPAPHTHTHARTPERLLSYTSPSPSTPPLACFVFSIDLSYPLVTLPAHPPSTRAKHNILPVSLRAGFPLCNKLCLSLSLSLSLLPSPPFVPSLLPTPAPSLRTPPPLALSLPRLAFVPPSPVKVLHRKTAGGRGREGEGSIVRWGGSVRKQKQKKTGGSGLCGVCTHQTTTYAPTPPPTSFHPPPPVLCPFHSKNNWNENIIFPSLFFPCPLYFTDGKNNCWGCGEESSGLSNKIQ